MRKIFSALTTMPRTLWLLTSLALCFVIIQYHVSSTWILSTFSGRLSGNEHGVDFPLTGGQEDNNETFQQSRQAEEIAKSVIGRMQFDNDVVLSIGDQVLKDVAYQIARQIVSNTNCADALTSPNLKDKPQKISKVSPIYVVTPTYKRPEQIPELTRLSQTLMHVEHLHWLVIEDSVNKTHQVTKFLNKTPISYHHLTASMPNRYKRMRGAKPKGVSNRNEGIQWVRENAVEGVLYFADDDNTYDLELFDEMRDTNKVSMWPVGLCTKTALSSPIVKNGKFSGFYDGWMAGRKFPVDMAGFAVGVKFLLERPKAVMPYKPGFEEDGFLKNLAPFEPFEIELKANNCTKILVWHTQTKKNEPSPLIDRAKFANTNILKLKELLV